MGVANNIGRDYFVDVEGEYNIYQGDKLIYKGQTYKDTEIKWNVLCENELSSFMGGLTANPTFFVLNNYIKDFTLEIPQTNDTYKNTFCNNWTMDVLTKQTPYKGFTIMSDPIRSYIAPAQSIVFSVFNSDDTIKRLTYGVFQIDYFDRDVGKVGVVIIDPRPKDNRHSYLDYDIDGYFLEIKPDICGKWEAIYLNAYGGYDGFLFTNEVEKKSVNIDRKFYNREYFNVYGGERSKINYMSTLTESITLNTGLLNDSESERLYKHLLSSNCIFLRNLDTMEAYSANIISSNYEEKNYLNQGRKKVSYDITFELALPNYRKM